MAHKCDMISVTFDNTFQCLCIPCICLVTSGSTPPFGCSNFIMAFISMSLGRSKNDVEAANILRLPRRCWRYDCTCAYNSIDTSDTMRSGNIGWWSVVSSTVIVAAVSTTSMISNRAQFDRMTHSDIVYDGMVLLGIRVVSVQYLAFWIM